MNIRVLRQGEGFQAAALVASCPEAAQWSAADYDSMTGGGRFCLVLEEESGRWAGLIAVSVVAPEAEILNLAVPPDKRRRGVASVLLAEALRRIEAEHATKAWLEVRESNYPALAFYVLQGFALAGRRPGYYREPGEDALILARELVPSRAA